MATAAVSKPRQLKNISVVIGTTEYAACTQSFSFTPQTTTSSTQGGTPDAIFTDTAITGWTLAWKFLQDAESIGSLTDYLFLNAGKTVDVSFVPYGGTGWKASVILPAPPIGGDINAWLADTITCGVVGKPSRIADDVATPQQ